ncbi:Asp23/Gls24 family envelope stress response protein [Curtobacterium sp. ISL-83]|uniref:Asp23/Gls24 family envelope stress response protein n=1 Tax=Curtobacterium sp. ISL-83 TaxID=2819145 RepID=UPI001BE5CEB2|nr:Asp23/Gls24 family envelope stress response protein [Curtobacterium sp. ISL-83]MBT2502675.1 Asp23/Gls24 family envelope stress response protein [Curtobacterium sp. ISL-83]
MASTTNRPEGTTTVAAGTTGAGTSARVDGNTATGTTTTQVTARGKTIIDDAVVAKVAGIAARDVPGVFALGGNTARAFGAIRDAIGSSALGQGVRVEVGETQVAVDLTIVVDYPTPMMAVATAVRTAVTDAITELVGLEVTEVNIAINDVNIPALAGTEPDVEGRVR